MTISERSGLAAAAAALLLVSSAPAAAERLFVEGRHGRSWLAYRGEVPVLHLFGAAEEMGFAAGRLTGPAVRELAPAFDREFRRYLESLPARRRDPAGLDGLVAAALKGVPPQRRIEMEAYARGAGIAPEVVFRANLLPEILGRTLCSTLFISAERMKDGRPAFCRNLDYPPVADLHRFGLVAVYHETGRRAVAAFTFPGLVGLLTGMNEAGLAGATMDVVRNAGRLRPDAPPRFLLYRELLARHETVAAALAELPPACLSGGNLMLVDAGGDAAVLESPGEGWSVRRPEGGILYATNHFRSTDLGGPSDCGRYAALADQDRRHERFSPDQLLRLTRLAAQTFINLQALVIRPAEGEVLFAFGRVPAASGPWHRLARTDLFTVEPHNNKLDTASKPAAGAPAREPRDGGGSR